MFAFLQIFAGISSGNDSTFLCWYFRSQGTMGESQPTAFLQSCSWAKYFCFRPGKYNLKYYFVQPESISSVSQPLSCKEPFEPVKYWQSP